MIRERVSPQPPHLYSAPFALPPSGHSLPPFGRRDSHVFLFLFLIFILLRVPNIGGPFSPRCSRNSQPPIRCAPAPASNSLLTFRRPFIPPFAAAAAAQVVDFFVSRRTILNRYFIRRRHFFSFRNRISTTSPHQRPCGAVRPKRRGEG